jgi:hypothetical protein
VQEGNGMWILPHANPFMSGTKLNEKWEVWFHTLENILNSMWWKRLDRVHESFSRSPCKSIRQASRELGVPRTTVHNIVHKRLYLRAYKLQLLHHIKPDDHRKGTDFAVEMLSRIEENDSYLDLVLFSDESVFHVCGKVIRHNCHIWSVRIHTKWLSMKGTHQNSMSG